jgi:hypothetical protein
MQKSLTVFLLTALAVVVVPLRSAEASVLDQSDTVGISEYASSGTVGQTFTVGITGTLTSVELKMDPFGNSINAKIATTNASQMPTNTILGQSSYPSGNEGFDQWISFNLSPAISVYAGEVLAIEVYMSGLGWDGDPNHTYAGGQAFMEYNPGQDAWTANSFGDSPVDLNFQTFVTPAPEPSSVALLGSALSLLACFRLLKRRRATSR